LAVGYYRIGAEKKRECSLLSIRIHICPKGLI